MWVLIGKATVVMLVTGVLFAISAILEATWPDVMAEVFEFIVEGGLMAAVVWLIFGRGR